MQWNNSYVGSCTRAYLSIAHGLPSDVLEGVERALSHIRPTSPCGLIYDMARVLGAPDASAVNAAVAVELWYAACSLTDDIQDGDAGYAGKTIGVQVNVQAMLICTAHRALQMVNAAGTFYDSGVTMLVGQAEELRREWGEAWATHGYERVARSIAGVAFASYFSLVPIAADKQTESPRWTQYGAAFGMILQIIADAESKDPRFKSIAISARQRIVADAEREFRNATDDVPEAEKITKITLARLRWLEKAGWL